MEWLFRDVTETVSVAELIWTSIAVLGALICLWIAIPRARTLHELFARGIDGRTRLLAIVRLYRIIMLGIVFMLITVPGVFAMTIPTNPAINTANPSETIPVFAILLMEIVLFVKLIGEEVLETVIINMRDMQHAAQHESTPRLGN